MCKVMTRAILLRRTLNGAHLDSWNAYKQRVLRLCQMNSTHYLVVGSVMIASLPNPSICTREYHSCQAWSVPTPGGQAYHSDGSRQTDRCSGRRMQNRMIHGRFLKSVCLYVLSLFSTRRIEPYCFNVRMYASTSCTCLSESRNFHEGITLLGRPS